ncbi:hypothetical protein N752_00565 [Desulforamulus aquiferis]|nr:hypothetical protein N752_00565 [Desulforamulus aquiferis]
MEITGASTRDIKRLVPEALEQVGLKGKDNLLPAQMSGGEQQRVCIARAIVNNPLMIIADEPTGNLDPITSKEIAQLFQEINRRGTTILMVTHDSGLVNNLKKRVIEVAGGVVVRDEESGVYSSEL